MRASVLLVLVLLSGSIGLPDPSVSTDAFGSPESSVWIWSDPGHAHRVDAHGSAAHRVEAHLALQGILAHRYPHLDQVAFEAPHHVAAALVQAFGGRVDANEHMDLHLDASVAFIEADRVRDKLGLRRDGPTVLVVDTGVDSSHPDFVPGENLAANVQADRTGGIVTGVLSDAPVIDMAGHGTHVAGIVAGIGQSLGRSDPLYETFQGVYANGRVAGFQASTEGGEEVSVDTVAALEAFDWALANKNRYDIQVVTNSWGLPGPPSEDHPVNQATQRLYLQGMVVVFSAGNEGEKGGGTLNKYCLVPWVLCVAAGDLDGSRAGFSSYGQPASESRPWDHPDITAPGVRIRSADPPSQASAAGTVSNIAAGRTSDGLYRDRSGSSMAAPHVAGAAALLLAANPGLSPDQVMDILVATAEPMADQERKVGGGYLNARLAYNLAVQTVGNRDAFLDGKAVKYAGSLSGDPELANDPVTQGYDGELIAGPTLAPAREQSWLLSPLGGAMAGGIVVAALLNILLGVRFRRRGAATAE